MKVDIAKLSDKPVDLPFTLAPDSMMNLFSMPPVTKTAGNILGDLDMLETRKGKGKDKNLETELPNETPREECRNLEKARRESKKIAK